MGRTWLWLLIAPGRPNGLRTCEFGWHVVNQPSPGSDPLTRSQTGRLASQHPDSAGADRHYRKLEGSKRMILDTKAELMQRWLSWSLRIVILAAIMALSGCKKKPVAPAPPPPPPPAAPTATISAKPEVIEAGQSSTLTWQTRNATEVTLDGQIVHANGSKTVAPNESTTYRVNAKGPGGTQEAAVRITVTQPPPPPPPGPGEEELFARNIKNIYFGYDKYDIRPDQQAALQANVQWLMQHPNVAFTIEGHCDERGSIEYNLALGDNRANAVKAALVQGGVSADRIRTISYGKERPICTESNETCWQQNRRAHFVYQK